MRFITKINGSKLNPGSKKRVGKKTNPKYTLGSKQKNNFIVHISFKKEDTFVKEKMIKILQKL